MPSYEQILALAMANEMHRAAKAMDFANIRWLCDANDRYLRGEWIAVDESTFGAFLTSALNEEFDIAAAESGADRELDGMDFETWCLEHSFAIY